MSTANDFVEIRLGFPPTINTYWRRVGHKTLISEGGRKYRRDVADRVLVSKIRRPIQGPLHVVILAMPPDRRRRDLDNLLKVPLDALQHAGVYLDDFQICDLQIRRGIVSPKDPRIMVYIEQIEVPHEIYSMS